MQPVKGIVFIEINGKFIPITEVRQIPNGAIINALHGTVALITAAGPAGRTSRRPPGPSARSRRPRPRPRRERSAAPSSRSPRTTPGSRRSSLVEARFAGAPDVRKLQDAQRQGDGRRALKKTLQLLHGQDNHGKFRTKGRYAAATTRGTVWSIADRCDGTLTQVSGQVVVSDFVRHKTITVRAGHSYLALARPPRHK